MPRSQRSLWPNVVLWALILAYIAFFSAFSIAKHDALQTHTRDLGNMDQPIWNTLHGRILEETRADGRQATRLTDHFEPFFIIVSLVFLLWDDVRALLVFQTVFLALGALPIYWLARDRFDGLLDGDGYRWMGVAFAGVYLLFPALQSANLTEFHASPLAVPLLLCAYYFGRKGETLPFWIFSLLSLTVKEEISLITLMLGLYLVVKGEKRWAGALLSLVSAVWFSIATFVIIPHYAGQFYAGVDESIYFMRYSDLGSGPKDILRTILRQPELMIRTLLEPARLRYTAGLLASVAFLPLLDPLTTLIALPVFLANILSNYPLMYSGELHYSAPLVPFIAAGAVGGAGWLMERLIRTKRIQPRLWGWALVTWLLLCGLGYHVLRGYTPLSVRFQPPEITAHHRLLDRFSAQIPPDAALSTTPALFPHFSHRQRILEFPVFTADTDFVLLDVVGTTDMHPKDFYRAYWDLLGLDYSIVDAADGYILLQRTAGPQLMELPEDFYSFVQAQDPQPDFPYSVEFGGMVRFLGFSLVDDPQWRMTRVRTYWEVLEKPPPALRLYPFVIDDEGNVVDDTDRRPMVGPIWYPPERWAPGEVLVFETLPWNLGDSFTVCMGVVDGTNWYDPGARLPITGIEERDTPIFSMEGGTWARLASFERRPAWAGSRLRPVSMHDDRLDGRFTPLNVTLSNGAESVELLGYQLQPAPAAAGEEVELRLLWRAGTPLGQDYTVFVHLLSADGSMAGAFDSLPNWRGPLPTSAWPAGEVILDVHRFVLPADIPPGNYALAVGMYYWETLERLGEAVPLGTLTVPAR